MNRSFSPPLPLVSPSQRPICLYFTCARAQKTLSCRCESFFSYYTYHSLVILFISTIVYPFPLSTSQQRTYHYLFLYIYSHHVLYSFCKNNIKSNYLYPETIADTNRIPRTAVYIPCDPCIDKGSLCVCVCVCVRSDLVPHSSIIHRLYLFFSFELEHTPFFFTLPPFYGRTSWKLYMRVADSYSSMPTLTCRRILWVIFARSCTLFIPNFLLLHIGGLSTAGK